MSEYPRDEAGFSRAHQSVEWHVGFHGTPIWLYATERNYVVSIVAPERRELAMGTAANQYDSEMKIIDTIYALDFADDGRPRLHPVNKERAR